MSYRGIDDFLLCPCGHAWEVAECGVLRNKIDFLCPMLLGNSSVLPSIPSSRNKIDKLWSMLLLAHRSALPLIPELEHIVDCIFCVTTQQKMWRTNDYKGEAENLYFLLCFSNNAGRAAVECVLSKNSWLIMLCFVAHFCYCGVLLLFYSGLFVLYDSFLCIQGDCK